MPISKKLLKKIETNIYTDKELNLSGKNIKYSDIKKLVRALKKNNHIKVLNLEANYIKDKSAKLLSSLNTIEELAVTETYMTDIGVSFLIKSSIKRLFVGNIQSDPGYLTDNCLKHIGENSTLEELRIYTASISEKGAELISNNNSLKCLTIADGDIDDEGIKYLAQHKKLEKLSLSSNHITSKGVIFLSRNKKISEIDLSFNPIDNESAPYIASMKSLTKIDLISTRLTRKGIQIIQNSLSLEIFNLFDSNEDVDEDTLQNSEQLTEAPLPPLSPKSLTFSFDADREAKRRAERLEQEQEQQRDEEQDKGLDKLKSLKLG